MSPDNVISYKYKFFVNVSSEVKVPRGVPIMTLSTLAHLPGSWSNFAFVIFHPLVSPINLGPEAGSFIIRQGACLVVLQNELHQPDDQSRIQFRKLFQRIEWSVAK